MSPIEDFMHRLPNDVGGLPSGSFERVEHELEPWEKRCPALADVLDFHKIINTEEKRRGVEALGAEMIGRLGYYERWLTVFAVILSQKGMLTLTELAEKCRRWANGGERMPPEKSIIRQQRGWGANQRSRAATTQAGGKPSLPRRNAGKHAR